MCSRLPSSKSEIPVFQTERKKNVIILLLAKRPIEAKALKLYHNIFSIFYVVRHLYVSFFCHCKQHEWSVFFVLWKMAVNFLLLQHEVQVHVNAMIMMLILSYFAFHTFCYTHSVTQRRARHGQSLSTFGFVVVIKSNAECLDGCVCVARFLSPDVCFFLRSEDVNVFFSFERYGTRQLCLCCQLTECASLIT